MTGINTCCYFCLLVVVVLLSTMAFVLSAVAWSNSTSHWSCGMTVELSTVTKDDGYTFGYLYRTGTLKEGDDGVVLERDGSFSPQYPQQMLGFWTQSQQDGGFSTEYFYFRESGDTLITQGTTLLSESSQTQRTVVGATGLYRGASDNCRCLQQLSQGTNRAGNPNIRISFQKY